MVNAIHETINSRLKIFIILKHTYHHILNKNGIVFRDIVVIIKIDIEVESPIHHIKH